MTGIKNSQVASTVNCNGGATVPFIARYRKEATGGLSDTQLRDLSDRMLYLNELHDRKQAVINLLKSKESSQLS